MYTSAVVLHDKYVASNRLRTIDFMVAFRVRGILLQAEKTSRKAQLADRLVNGLSGENKRWSETISRMEVAGSELVSRLLSVKANCQ